MIARWLRTVRPLRPSQVLWRLGYAAERRIPIALRRAYGRKAWRPPDRISVRDDFPVLPPRPSWGLESPSTVDELAVGVFDLLNEKAEVGLENPDWRLGNRAQNRLWTVTLHYHPWAMALAEAAMGETSGDRATIAARLLRHYVTDWIEQCPWHRPGAAALAWNAYAVATRSEYWIRAYLQAKPHIFAPDPELEGLFLRSLWQQAAYLSDHVEWDLRGNHLLRDAVGLAWAGRFFDGARPRAWQQQATELAVEQVAEQILSDGGHFERSPGYHVEVMEDLLILALLLEDVEARSRLRQVWAGMARYLAWMRHPDGDVPLLNDGSLRGPRALSELLTLGERLEISTTTKPRSGGRYLAESGVAVWHGDPWTLFFDLGSVGPDVQPGHAHADTLTLESSFAGRRLFVDPGTFSYDDDPRRGDDRSTEAHNTVSIDGVDSSEMWKIFRVGRRARPRDLSVELRADGMSASGSHDGYDHLAGRPRHGRRVTVEDGGALTLIDRLEGSGAHRAQGGLLVAPSWTVSEAAGGWNLTAGESRLLVIVEGPVQLERFCERRPYHPRYGVEHEATRIGWRWQGKLPIEIRIEVRA